MITKTTERGFAISEFTDAYGNKCSIQMSSNAMDDYIWLGIDDPNPQIMNTDARRLGLPFTGEWGWTPYYIPKEVSIWTRMHLSRGQVAELLPYLQQFVDTGELP